MALISYNEVGISGIAAAVPSKVINNINYDLYFKKEDIKEIVENGVRERRFADENTCSSDLYLAAAERLFTDMNIDRGD